MSPADMSINKYRIRFYFDEDAITSPMLAQASERAYDCFDGQDLSKGNSAEITITTHRITDEDSAHDISLNTLINIIFVGARDDYTPVLMRARSASTVPNIMFATKRNFTVHRRQSLIKIAAETDAHLQFYDNFEDELFLEELVNIMLSISSAYSEEIYGTKEDSLSQSQRLEEAATQLDFAISAIEEMRLNNTYEIVSSLREVHKKVKLTAVLGDYDKQNSIQKIFEQIIILSAQLLDAMENKKFAGLAVCGIVGSVVGWIGTPAITATALCMAYAQGPETLKAFLADVISRIGLADANKTSPKAKSKPRAPRRRRVAK